MISDKTNAIEPDIRFYVDRKTNLVVLVTSTTSMGITKVEKGGRWTYMSESEQSKYSDRDYSRWTYDWENEDDTPGSGAHIDPDNDIDWEIDLVQRWMKSEALALDDIVGTCDLVGIIPELLTGFNHREEIVIRLRYGISEGEEKPWFAIAEDLGVSEARVKEIASQALPKLHSRLHSDPEQKITLAQGDKALSGWYEELQGSTSWFWTDKVPEVELMRRGQKLDVLCYLVFPYFISYYFNLEDPGLIEVPQKSIEVAENINSLLGCLARRSVSSDEFAGFSRSAYFDLHGNSLATLADRAREASNRLSSLLPDEVSGFEEEFQNVDLVDNWKDLDLVDCLALAVQMRVLFSKLNSLDRSEISPLRYFLRDKALRFGSLVPILEKEIDSRGI